MARRRVETGGKYVNRHLFLYLEVGSCRNQDGTMRGGASLGLTCFFACLRCMPHSCARSKQKLWQGGTKGFCKCVRIVFFSPCVPACPEYAILREAEVTI